MDSLKPKLVEVDPRSEYKNVSLDPRAFSSVITQQGIRLVHHRAFRCPVGLVDLSSNRRPNPDHSGCDNGFHHVRVGELYCLFTGNSESFRNSDVGFLDGSTAMATAQRFYTEIDCDGNVVALEKPVSIAPFDRFYLIDEAITVPHWQLFETSIDGKDRLDFPVVAVLDMMDSEGKTYEQGKDFEVKGGWIHWTGARPSWDPGRNKGQICAARFEYRPFWVVSRMPHQIRFAQVDDPVEGVRQTVTMPHQMELVREYIHHTADANPESALPNSRQEDRRGPVPKDGAFGPR